MDGTVHLFRLIVIVTTIVASCGPSPAPSVPPRVVATAPSGRVSHPVASSGALDPPAASVAGQSPPQAPTPLPSTRPVPSVTPSGPTDASPQPSPVPSQKEPFGPLLAGMPPILDTRNIYSADAPGAFSPTVAADRPLIYVPDSGGSTVTELDPATHKVVRTIQVGRQPQHVVPSYDLRTLWVTSELGNRLTALDARTGLPVRAVTVADPYNLYFTPEGRFAIVVEERLRRLRFSDPATMRAVRSVSVPCPGADHADFTANGRLFLLSCESGSAMIVVDVERQRVVRRFTIPRRGSPQDVKLSPDGRTFYVSDLVNGGVWRIDASTFHIDGFIRTAAGAHGLYVSRDARSLYVANRAAGSVSVIDFATHRRTTTWVLAGGGSPDMGNVSADGTILWLSGRYHDVVYAISTRTGRLLARVPAGPGPHGVCVWPLPGRYSVGHTGILR